MTLPALQRRRAAPSDGDDICPNCGGLGVVAGCFEDTCSGADCDPEDAENCCAPMRCDWCRPKKRPALDPLMEAMRAGQEFYGPLWITPQSLLAMPAAPHVQWVPVTEDEWEAETLNMWDGETPP